MLSRLEILGVDRIVVEAIPLLKSLASEAMVLLIVPVEHLLVELQADALTVLAQNTFRVIQEVIGVDDANFNPAVFAVGIAVDGVFATAHFRTNEARILAIVEKLPQLVVSGLAGHERVEASPLHQRWNAAAVVARHRKLWMANQEGEMKPLQNLPRNDRRIFGLGRSIVGEGRAFGRTVGTIFTMAVDDDSRVTATGDPLETEAALAVELILGANTTLDFLKRRGDVSLLKLWWDQIIGDVFDEDTLSLIFCQF